MFRKRDYQRFPNKPKDETGWIFQQNNDLKNTAKVTHE